MPMDGRRPRDTMNPSSFEAFGKPEWKEWLVSELERLAPDHRASFAAACGEPLVAAYRIFSQMKMWGEYGAVRGGLDIVWEMLADPSRDRGELKARFQACQAANPETLGLVIVPIEIAATEATYAVCSAIQCCLTGQADDAAWAAAAAQNPSYWYP